jgi:hypothetical protein
MRIFEQIKSLYKKHPVITFLGGIVAILFIAAVWYVSLPALAVFFMWNTNRFNKSTKTKITIGLVAVCIGLVALHVYLTRTPTLVISTPQDNASVQAHTVAIKGSVSPADAVLTINDTTIQPDSKGNFSYSAPLFNETNSITITAKNYGKVSTKTLSVTRVYSNQEKTDMAAATLKAQQDALAADAKAKADQLAYDNSPAGKLCKKHPEWTPDDCTGVAKHQYWIGMSLDMLKAEHGLPNHSNPSDYGSGTHWQWCWDDITPSCFYGGDDMIITSYN